MFYGWVEALKTGRSILLYILITCIALIMSIIPFQAPAEGKGKDIRGPEDSGELKEFMDNFFTAEMDKCNIPGAVVSIVRNGRVLYEKGYGYANLEKKIGVNPEKTLFRIGPLSTLFTSTAAMQLKERGKIDFNKDINEYLSGFKIEDNYSRPITMYNLLTHTAGFDDRTTGMEAEDYGEVVPLSKYLTNNMPGRIRGPGKLAQYSNHGIALTGYIVEKVSRMPFEKYIENNIFKPLGMDNTYARLSQDMLTYLSLEYSYKNGQYKPMKFYDYNVYPADSICSTASDMNKFMIAHLNNGDYKGIRVLKEETAIDMHSQHFTHDSFLAGMCYGFYEIKKNSRRFIANIGGTNGSYSLLLLDLKSSIGMFVSTNGSNGYILTSDLEDKFIDHYYPMIEEAPDVLFVMNTLKDNKKIAGEYRPIKYSRDTLDKLLLLLSPQVRVDVKDGNLVYRGPKGAENYTQVGPLIFKNMDNNTYIIFKEDDNKDMSLMFTETPFYAFEKVKWYESSRLHVMLLGIFVLTFISFSIYYMAMLMKGKKRGILYKGTFADRLSVGVCILNLVFVLGMAAVIVYPGTKSEIAYKLPLPVKVLLISQIASALLTVPLVVASIIVWIKDCWPALKRIYFTLVVLSCVGFTAIMYYYNLIGIKY